MEKQTAGSCLEPTKQELDAELIAAMTHTQAQREAAAKALEAYDLASGPTANYKEMATAALAAAAQVGESVESQLSTAIENVKAETIERCAQVAEEMGRPGSRIVGAEKIAAAIRSMKD